ncbi:hypothetical protein GQ54DRAFT_265586, partial [Martensiomyces pterosporus]
RAETCRALLSYSGAPWENVHPAWPSEKLNQPFGKMPVLIERSEDGSEFVLSDSVAIEKYLATKYGLAVTGDARAVAHQDELRNQIRDIYELIVLYKFGHEDVRPGIMDKFNTLAKALVRFHEEFLKKNGSNGHYFGSRTTYVDIAVYANVAVLRDAGVTFMPGAADLFTEENAPEISKVLKAVEADPAMTSYVASLQ